MRRSVQHIVLRVALTLLLATSLLSAGFAHRAMVSTADAETLQTLAAMGLTASDLCGDTEDDGGKMDMGDCPVCHIASSMLIPQCGGGVKSIAQRTAAAVLLPAEAHVLGRSTNPATPARAPPLA